MSVLRHLDILNRSVLLSFSKTGSQLQLRLDRFLNKIGSRQSSGVAGLIANSKSLSYSTNSTVAARKTTYLSSVSYNQRLIGGVIKMSTLPHEVKAKLDQIADAKIDESGKFKYILIKVFAKDKDGKHLDENSKVVVRGRADCLYHGDIFDKFQEETATVEDIDDDILGGGRIERAGNKIHVYGYSQGYGKADHTLTVEILKKKYPSHEITWSDEGY